MSKSTYPVSGDTACRRIRRSGRSSCVVDGSLLPRIACTGRLRRQRWPRRRMGDEQVSYQYSPLALCALSWHLLEGVWPAFSHLLQGRQNRAIANLKHSRYGQAHVIRAASNTPTFRFPRGTASIRSSGTSPRCLTHLMCRSIMLRTDACLR